MSFLVNYPDIKVIQSLAKRRKRNIYLVGGFLRDQLLNREQVDFDFAVDRGAIKFAEKFAEQIKGAFVLLDDEVGCARVAKKRDGRVWTYDFADYKANTMRSDLNRRDFTINTLCVDLLSLNDDTEVTKKILDYKKGKPDLQNKLIRMTQAGTFKDDPLRLLRAYSLQAIFGFKIEAKTLAQIKKDLDLILETSDERVRDEFFKILESPRAFKVLKAMDRIGLLERVMPQIKVMDKITQGGFHHLDVWPHSLETVNQLEKLVKTVDSEVVDHLMQPMSGLRNRLGLLKLGCLLHDIGKPDTKKKENNHVSFHGHEFVGKRITKSIAQNLKLSTKERRALQDMVVYHLRPGYLSNEKRPSKRAIFRYFRDTKDEAVSILLLSLADQRSTCGPLTTEYDQKHHEAVCLGLVDEYFAKKKEKPLPKLITGNDLIKEFRLKPSVLFKEILSKVEEQQVMSVIKTKQEALQLAKEMIPKG